jgi:hypothetical protein
VISIREQRRLEDLARAQARFWSKVDLGGDGDCWLWAASVGKNGYGQFSWASRYGRSRPTAAHRVAFELANGVELDDSLVLVCHACDVPLCVNPRHLFLGTHTDNMRDAAAKGRLSTPARRVKRMPLSTARDRAQAGAQ